MQFNPAILRGSNARIRTASPSRNASPSVSAEIYGYIAARDLSLADAERNVTDLTLTRAFLANELVESCLQTARSAYQAQYLAETEAATERTRCEAVKRRIGQLRSCAFAAA